ncbi:hypothetical protein BDZ90DRAFT_228993 [Jaminaea rosea]|uniref:H/ACA ribonucleoprotein complex subunit NOP10 n=1 Tax=Jaminaea rosea TaxID=1569628 RepID=A0A316UXB6_9BASI|nr:hypothetical protein BDZ90DRAFT_228993 [Jaminaea rosea]PWN29946.1 hypothetical protein BDZ90DRAFT_228993 [Jaminaea rosea]
MHLMYSLDSQGKVRISPWLISFDSSRIPLLTIRLSSPCSHLSLLPFPFLSFVPNHLSQRVYTLRKATPANEITKSAHPARFSPDDKFSRHRVTVKRRFGILPTQLRAKPL